MKESKLHEEYEEFFEEILNESERASVILGSSKIDFLLREILVLHFIPIARSDDDLLDSEKPLGSFSSRINMCYRIGLLDSEFCNILHLVRKIRNNFAHESEGAKLNQKPHKDRIREIDQRLKKYPIFKQAKEKLFQNKDIYSAMYYSTLMIIVGSLEKIRKNVKTISNNKASSILNNK